MVTTHMALRDVPDAITPEGIITTAGIVDTALKRYFAVQVPRLALCGLNPHAGDGGRFGDEEARVLGRAVDAAQQAGIDLVGPCPADTVFVQAAEGRYDAVLPLYHDQGMIPVKMAGLGTVVNVTLGLPIIRTSVGHGTAFDIAGQGAADPSSLLSAIGLAAAMVRADRAAHA
jgi:4-hydroxythreonine-4-phosphate dehydrogenase